MEPRLRLARLLLAGIEPRATKSLGQLSGLNII